MNRLFTILVLGLLALAPAGWLGGAAAAGAARCAPDPVALLDELAGPAEPAALRETAPAPHGFTAAPQLACNLRCAQGCNQRYSSCNTRACKEQRSACISGCGC